MNENVILLLRFLLLLLVFYFLFFRKKAPAATMVTQNICPYKVLGLSRGATEAEVKQAYRKSLAQYHPGKVSHLGPDLKELALNKTIEIREAYEQIQKKA